MKQYRKAGPQLLASLVKQDSLKKLRSKTTQLTSINQTANALFSQYGLSGQVKIANIRNGVMVLEASSAPWANRIRQLRLTLLTELRQQLPSLVTIDIKINPNLSTVAVVSKQDKIKATQSTQRLSSQSASHILSLAEHAPAGLKEKLHKLASLAAKK